MRTCDLKNATDFDKLLHLVDKLENKNENYYYNTTGCLSTCDKRAFDLQPYTEIRNYNGYSKGEYSVSFVLSTTSHTKKIQYVIYDGNSFVADVGGYLGLLLGYSILSILKDLAKWTAGRMGLK